MRRLPQDPKDVAAKLKSGDRRVLARAITAAESSNARDQAFMRDVFAAIGTDHKQALRLGLSGTPGVGKSTFLERFGTMLTAKGQQVAVLAIDPSSAQSGGSILGDKTRMPLLSRDACAYIRPSPAGRHLGGLAAQSRAAVALCEAAGFDVVIVETVGVGQSEAEVAQLCDVFLLLLAPGGGDELQGVKRGILELADMVLINKADGALQLAAQQTASDYASALRLLRAREGDPDGWPKVSAISGMTGAGLEQVWTDITELSAHRQDVGIWQARRHDQDLYWFEQSFEQAVLSAVKSHLGTQTAYHAARANLQTGASRLEPALYMAMQSLHRLLNVSETDK